MINIIKIKNILSKLTNTAFYRNVNEIETQKTIHTPNEVYKKKDKPSSSHTNLSSEKIVISTAKKKEVKCLDRENS